VLACLWALYIVSHFFWGGDIYGDHQFQWIEHKIMIQSDSNNHIFSCFGGSYFFRSGFRGFKLFFSGLYVKRDTPRYLNTDRSLLLFYCCMTASPVRTLTCKAKGVLDAFWAKIEASDQQIFNFGFNHVKIPMKKEHFFLPFIMILRRFFPVCSCIMCHK